MPDPTLKDLPPRDAPSDAILTAFLAYVGARGLEIVEARVKGSGAGMEPGPDARFDGTWWRWRPKLPVANSVRLGRSDAVPEGWELCAEGACRAVADARESADSVTLSVCD